MDDQGCFKDEKSLSSPTSTGHTIINIPNDVHTVDNTILPEAKGGNSPLTWILSWLRPAKGKDHDKVTNCHSLEDWPLGYPRLAGFLSSDQNFMVYRGFHYLHSRLLLHHQYDIEALERELETRDMADYHNGDGNRLQSRETDDGDAVDENEERPRAMILSEIREKLLNYDELLIKARDLASFQKPSNRDYRSVRAWFNNRKPLIAKESEYIKGREDIVTLRQGRECAGFDGLVESGLQRLKCDFTKYIFCSKDLRDKTSDKFLDYYSPERVDKLVGMMIASVIFVLLILPVVVMYELTSIGSKDDTFGAVGVLMIFTLLFSALMSLLTRAKRHEVFAASAAYCAVLVVFINFSNLPAD